MVCQREYEVYPLSEKHYEASLPKSVRNFLKLSLFISYEPQHNKPTQWHVHPAKTLLSLHIHTVWWVFAVCKKHGNPQNARPLCDCTGWSEFTGAHMWLYRFSCVLARFSQINCFPNNIKMSHVMRKSASAICEQQRRRSAYMDA